MAATQSRANQAFTVITAPFAGVVTAKFVDAGAMATPGTPFCALRMCGSTRSISR